MTRPAPTAPADRRDLDGPAPASCAAARLGLYVHVPFCAVRCAYCDFSSGALSARALERYLAGMEAEASRRAPDAGHAVFTSVFFGGGTPSALSARHFARLVRALRSHFAIAPEAEITLEANPESVRPALLDAWSAAGVNRLSFGVQSFHPDELERLGRIHDAARPGEAVALARRHGYRRVSLDLMFGFPGHTGERFAATLERALELDPEHLSAYCFIPEPGTPMGDAVLRGRLDLPDADRQADLYASLTARLALAGYGCYETSNFCRPRAEARHNLVYWLRRDYLGLGPSAHGLWRGTRYGNHYATERWASELEAGRPCDEREPESARSRADEIVMLGLRLSRGVSAADHAPERWREVTARYGPAFRRGLATGRLAATALGVRVPARHRFVADDVIAWLMASADRTDRAPFAARHDAAGFDSRATASVT
ncbi:MAG: radical SAM family heme chaperone HemW [Candidatus Eiseniibacteriota bacterium]